MSPRLRCVTTCARASARWVGRSARCSSRRSMRRASRPRSIGARRRSTWPGSRRRCTCSSCAPRSQVRRSARRRWPRPSRRSWSCTSRRSTGSAACSSGSASTTSARRSSRSCAAVGAWRPIVLSRCARTTCSSRGSPRRAWRARTRRVASRARSGASGAITSSRCRRSPSWASSTRCCSPAAKRTCAGGSSGGPRRSARRGRANGRRCARCPVSRSTPQRPQVRASTPSRWSRSVRTAIRSRWRSPA